jgi:zinc transport system permease protein
MWDNLVNIFSYAFMVRAIVVGIAVAISSSFLGSFLVLRNYSMIGHGLAHVSFGAVAVALFFNQTPILVTIPIVVVSSLFILYLSEHSSIGGDASIGLFSSVALAMATILSSVRGGFSTDLDSYLFGSILLLNALDVWIAWGVTILVVGVMVFYYDELFVSTFDESYARVNRPQIGRINVVLAVLAAVIITVGIQSIGVLLISAMVIFPGVIALQFRVGFRNTILLAVLISVINVVSGILASFILNLPTGSTIVMVSAVVLAISYIGNNVVQGAEG